MKTKLQSPANFFLILSLLILSCGPVNELLLTPANPNATPVAPGTESPDATAQPELSDIISADNANNLVEISSWGKGSGHRPTYSPDGTLLAVSSSSGIYLYDSQTLQENMYIDTYDVVDMAFSPDGKTLSVVTGSYYETTATQWDLATGSELNSWSVPLGYNNGENIVALSPDGETVSALDGTYEDGTVTLWDVASGQEFQSLSVYFAEKLAFSPDGKTLAVAKYPGLKLYDVSSGSELRTLDPGPTAENIISLEFSPDGSTLAVGTGAYGYFDTDENTFVWEVSSGRELLKFYTPVVLVLGDIAFTLAFSPDGKTLASGSVDAIKLWNAASGEELLTWSASNVERLVFSPDGKTLISASSLGDDSVKLWDAATGDLLNALKGDDVGGEVIFSPDSRTLAYDSDNFIVKLRDVASGEVRSLSGHPSYVNSLAFSPDGKILASGSSGNILSPGNNVLKLWDVASGQELHTLNGHGSNVNSVAFSPNGKLLASGSDDSTIKLWDVASGSEVRTLSGNTGLAYGLAFSPDGKMLASAFNDEAGDVVKLWDVASGSEVRTLSVNTNVGLNVAFSPDGKLLVSSNYFGYGLKQLWDVASGQELPTFSGDTDTQLNFVFSPDGKALAIGFEDGTVKVFDPASGQELHNLSGHTKAVYGLAFSPDGKILATGGGDNIKLWEVASGQELTSLSIRRSTLFFSPDGKLILVGSSRGWSLWGVSP